MLTDIRVYYEGNRLLKPGFVQFFAELTSLAKEKRSAIHFISAGSGANACRDFGIALKTNTGAWNILLKDSEGPDSGNLSTSLCREYTWDKVHADSIFWMVEMMESWFHADKDALANFYGEGFKKGALKANPDVEAISKSDLEKGLQNATRNTNAGGYFDNKTSHGPKLLARIDPKRVREAAPNCDKLFTAVLSRLS